MTYAHQTSLSAHAIPTSVMICILLLTMSGCGSQSRTVAFIPQTTADDLWEPAHMGAIAALENTHDHIYWNGPTSPDDVQSQIRILARVTQKDELGIIVAPDESRALMMPVQKAISRGIPTVVVGSPLPLIPAKDLFYILNDEEVEGQLAAKRIGEKLHGQGSVAILGLNPNIPGIGQRARSFEIALARGYPNIRIVAVHMGSYSELQSEQSARDALHANPHLNAILGLTRFATAGAFHALVATGETHHVLLVGCGQEYQLLYYLSQGLIDSIIAENTYEIGYKATQTILARRAGRNVSHILRIQPILITKTNMFSPEYSAFLTHNEQIAIP